MRGPENSDRCVHTSHRLRALRRALALVLRDVEKAGVRENLTSGEYHAAAMLLTSEAYQAVLTAAGLYDEAGDGDGNDGYTQRRI